MPVAPRDILNTRRIAELMESLGEDALRGIFSLYLTRARDDLDALVVHHQRGELALAEKRSHDLKGTSSNIGVVRVGLWAEAVNALHKLGAMEVADTLLPHLGTAFEEAVVEIVELFELD